MIGYAEGQIPSANPREGDRSLGVTGQYPSAPCSPGFARRSSGAKAVGMTNRGRPLFMTTARPTAARAITTIRLPKLTT